MYIIISYEFNLEARAQQPPRVQESAYLSAGIGVSFQSDLWLTQPANSLTICDALFKPWFS